MLTFLLALLASIHAIIAAHYLKQALTATDETRAGSYAFGGIAAVTVLTLFTLAIYLHELP